MALNLSEGEIKKRLIRLRNLENLHKKQGKRLEKYIRKYKEEKETRGQLEKLLETALIRIGELEKMVFGKKPPKKDDDNGKGADSESSSKKEKPKKQKHSRPIPKEEDITDIEVFSVSHCTCGNPLSHIEEHIRYEEDILLAAIEKLKTKKILKKIIQRGYCKACGNCTSGADLRGEKVAIGRNTQMLVSYMSIILDCSYSQIQTFLLDQYDFSLSEGEIANLLQKEHIRLLPEFESILTSIRGAPGKHLDETSWRIRNLGAGYAWVMSDAQNSNRAYLLASSRGKGQAEKMLGSSSGIRITDCYSSYKNMQGKHQVCWAHFFRKIRDLKENRNLPKEKKPYIKSWYNDFSLIYEKLRKTLEIPFDKDIYAKTEEELRTKLVPLLISNEKDPKKLKDLKNLMQEYDHALFTCLKYPNIPCDNNRAERDLRKLVIKRKKSFGSLTEKGANALSTLLTVYWSYRGRHKEKLFQALSSM